jgi:prepilin-type N-terminal cleavage/methylation domain-containing protein
MNAARPDAERGFTLIELLVVIAIIGLLSSVILASLNSARAKGRDASRTASIRQIQNALELYYDTNGSYISSADVVITTALTPLVPNYISALPNTSINTSNNPYRYYTASVNPAPWYAIYIPYETKAACYVCAGTMCQAGQGWWSVNICP